jgi:hypothetical protein
MIGKIETHEIMISSSGINLRSLSLPCSNVGIL